MAEKAKSIKTTNKQATENFNKAISSFDRIRLFLAIIIYIMRNNTIISKEKFSPMR